MSTSRVRILLCMCVCKYKMCVWLGELLNCEMQHYCSRAVVSGILKETALNLGVPPLPVFADGRELCWHRGLNVHLGPVEVTAR